VIVTFGLAALGSSSPGGRHGRRSGRERARHAIHAAPHLSRIRKQELALGGVGRGLGSALALGPVVGGALVYA